MHTHTHTQQATRNAQMCICRYTPSCSVFHWVCRSNTLCPVLAAQGIVMLHSSLSLTFVTSHWGLQITWRLATRSTQTLSSASVAEKGWFGGQKFADAMPDSHDTYAADVYSRENRPHPPSLSLGYPTQQIKVFVADIPRLTMQERMKGLCMRSQNTSKDVVTEASFSWEAAIQEPLGIRNKSRMNKV